MKGEELKRNSEEGGEERNRGDERKVEKGEQAEEDKGEKGGGGGGESAKGRGGEERRALLKMALGRREGATSSESPLTAQPAPGRLPPAPLCLAHTNAELTSFWLSGKGKRHLCEAGP